MSRIGKGLGLFCVLFLGAAQLWAAQNVAVIVGFRGDVDEDIVIQKHGRVVRNLDLSNAVAADLPLSEIAALRRNPRVRYVEPDAEATLQASLRPVNPFRKRRAPPYVQPAQTLPWGVDRIDAELVVLGGDPDDHQVPVAVVDTGIYYTHPDLVGNVNAGPTFVSGTSSSLDDEGHGTHVAGTIAAVNNAIGVIGVAPEAEVWGVKVLDRTGSGYYSAIVKGVDWAADNDMKVVNMSLGGTYNSKALSDACNAANTQGVLIVAAAGNSGTTMMLYPGAYPSVVCVGATDSTNALAYFSTRGKQLDVVAPGQGINSTIMPDRYQMWSGTSMATPHVAGAAALVWGDNPGFSNNDVRSRLQSTVTDLGTPGFDTKFGWGLINANRAVHP